MLYNFIQLEKGLADEGEDHDDFQELDPDIPKAAQLIEIFNNEYNERDEN
jgi:hypothetical protein